MRKENFIASKLFIRRLAELERSRIELEKQFRETLSLQKKKKQRNVESSPEPLLVITKGEFFKEITIDIYDRFALVFFYIEHSTSIREV